MIFLESFENPYPFNTQGVQIPGTDPIQSSFAGFPQEGKVIRIYNAPANSIVEIKEESEVSWTNLMTGDYDETPFAGGKHLFYLRFTPDDPRIVSQEVVELRSEEA